MRLLSQSTDEEDILTRPTVWWHGTQQKTELYPCAGVVCMNDEDHELTRRFDIVAWDDIARGSCSGPACAKPSCTM